MDTILTFLSLVSLCCVTIVAQAEFRCDYVRLSELNGWLKFHEMPSNWNEARLRCHMEGAILASPLNKDLKEAMTNEMKFSNVSCVVHTGIHATFSRGDFSSIEGVPLSKIPHTWAEGEPDNHEDKENCLVLLPDGTMGDTQCTELFPYFCYKEFTNNDTVLNRCGTTDDEYQYYWSTGSCYKLHKTRRTWPRAYMTCTAEGGHLAIMNSEVEIALLKKMLLSQFDDIVFIGYHDWFETGDWRSIHGLALHEEEYISLKEIPNNSTTGPFCGAIHRNTLVMKQNCEERNMFMCEMVPNSISCSVRNVNNSTQVSPT